MCTVCGCDQGGARVVTPEASQASSHDHDHGHDHGHGHGHGHGHDHDHPHDHDHHHHHDHHPADPHAARRITVERDLLAENQRFAEANRAWLARRKLLAINLLSSPGSGKTTLLVETVTRLMALPEGGVPCVVIEGDQQTSVDADRIRATGAPALQINTGKGCHLDAHTVGHALERLDPPEGALVFIENVGNLVCPAAFDLGEAKRVVLLSVTEGEDKPLKYPDIFATADLLGVTKTDLAPYVRFNQSLCVNFARRVRPGLPSLGISVESGDGLEAWITWLLTQRASLFAEGG
ncbi:hydrogenase nickel incorporation protein HypB [Pararhodospirillum photometricum]|nr:hydrogenase nickel incorporation protein HypB [Pararhodospirillum photometricum]